MLDSLVDKYIMFMVELTSDREEIHIREAKNDVILTSYGTFSAGVSISKESIIFLQVRLNQIKIYNRLVRPRESKESRDYSTLQTFLQCDNYT